MDAGALSAAQPTDPGQPTRAYPYRHHRFWLGSESRECRGRRL